MIHIHSPKVQNNTVVCKLDVSRPQSKFFKDDNFIVEYDESVESVPDSILAIPAVMNVAPIAWASNIEVSTPILDEGFYRALEHIRDGYAQLYPSVFSNDDHVITCERTIANHSPDASTPAVLFSGGVDSTAATLDVLEDSPALLTIQGSDINLDNNRAWQNVTKQVENFARSYKLPTHSCHSNFRDILRYRFLDYEYKSKLGRGFWVAVQVGTGLPAIFSPIAYKHGYNEIKQGSGYTADPEYPVPQPIFVNELAWSGTTVSISDVNVSRQEKISRIAQYFHSGNKLTIRSCLRSSDGKNCSECMKCRRTIVGLLLEDVDPNEVGYNVDNSTLPKIREDFESGNIQLYDVKIKFWNELKEKVNTEKEYLYDKDGFFKWLSEMNIEEYASDKKPFSAPVRIADKMIQLLPYPLNVAIYDTIRPVGSYLFGSD